VLSHPGGDLGACPQAELAQDITDVRVRGALRNDQLHRNFAIGQPARDQVSDLTLARTEGIRFALGGIFVGRAVRRLAEE
jgi:hypothetical protein